MKKIFTKEFAIGICVAVALVVLFCGIEFLKGISLFRPTNFYKAYYENVAGLEVAAPVHIDGYKVGQVREINFDYENPGKPIEVLLALDEELKLPTDSRAIIETSMLSGASIKLVLGHSSSMLAVGGQVLTDKASDLMASVSDQLMPTVNSILPRVDTLMYNLNLVAGNPALHSSITRLDAITTNLNSTAVGLNGAIGGLNNHLPGIMGNAYSVTNKLDSTMANLQTITYNIKSLPLDATVENVNQLTANLAAFSSELKNNQGTLGMLMRDPELYNRLNRIAADVDSLIVDLQRNPKRYVSIKLF